MPFSPGVGGEFWALGMWLISDIPTLPLIADFRVGRGRDPQEGLVLGGVAGVHWSTGVAVSPVL